MLNIIAFKLLQKNKVRFSFPKTISIARSKLRALDMPEFDACVSLNCAYKPPS